MMLLDDFFVITDKVFRTESPYATIRLNPGHDIYKAHFPDQPITPGVCQIQIVTELLSLYLDAEARLTDVKSVKYLSTISPDETPELTVRFQKVIYEDDRCKIAAVLEDGTRILSKMSMTYHVVRNHSDI